MKYCVPLNRNINNLKLINCYRSYKFTDFITIKITYILQNQ